MEKIDIGIVVLYDERKECCEVPICSFFFGRFSDGVELVTKIESSYSQKDINSEIEFKMTEYYLARVNISATTCCSKIHLSSA